MKTLVQTLAVLGLVCSFQGQAPLKFCDLLKNPEKYSDKGVTVRATYRYGYEWSELYCLDCVDQGKADLRFSEDLDKHSERVLKRLPKDSIVNLTVHGILAGPGEYGHTGLDRYRFTADKVEEVTVVLKGMHSLEDQKAAEKKWACGGTNPK
jgi:hypothetical protein